MAEMFGAIILSFIISMLVFVTVKYEVIEDTAYKIRRDKCRKEGYEINERIQAKKLKKLENLKLDSIYLDLSENEIKMIDEMCSCMNISRNKFLREGIKEVLKNI